MNRKQTSGGTTTVVHSNDQGVQHPVVDPVSREAAEAEIIAALKLRAGKNGSSEPNTQTEILAGTQAGHENLGVISDHPVQAAAAEQAAVPLLMSQKEASNAHLAAQNAREGAGVVFMDHGAPSGAPNENIPLSNSGGFSQLAVPGSVIPGYGSPGAVGGVFYSLENVASQGSVPSDTAGFVAEAPAVGLPKISKEQNETQFLEHPNNETTQNSSTKIAGEGGDLQTPGTNSSGQGIYQMASSLGGTVEGVEPKSTQQSVADDSSTSFFDGTDSLSTAKEKKLAVNDLEEPTGASPKPEFHGISINVTDAKTPIDVSGIVMTPPENDSSTPSLPKPSTTITDSTKALIVEGGNSDAPIDVSGIATSSETPADETETPSPGTTETDVGSETTKTPQNETGQPSSGSTASTKTKDDCKDDENDSNVNKSPHGKPVVFDAMPNATAAGASNPAAAEDKIGTSEKTLGSAIGNASGENLTEQNDAPSDEPTERRPGNPSVPSGGETTVNDSKTQPQKSQGTGTGYAVAVTFTLTDDDEITTTSAPLTTLNNVKASTPRSTESPLVTSEAQVTTPSSKTGSSEQDDREMGGVDVPEPISSSAEKPAEQSIATVVSQMMNSNETSEHLSVPSTIGNSVLSAAVKHTPLPISSVSVSAVGPSTATLPALGYATVKEIQIASQPALAPILKESPLISATTSSDKKQDIDRELQKSEVVESVANQDNASQAALPKRR
ncbi:hypothetical protein MTO96_017798 [Rhipicephalus appendiculatus]